LDRVEFPAVAPGEIHHRLEHGVVMLRTETGQRALARVPANDEATIGQLLNLDRTPVGTVGDIVAADDGVPEWRLG
ncbi:hypothetical protein JVV04_20310, partial [Vibrio cholerae O1]|uniref:hypothetical protein n=1 Tax=Vibrio cholerae TaxID=666 RepID=UPI001C0F4167